jgi:hypothetical protein
LESSTVAEEQYNLRQYEMALASFLEARSALASLSSTYNAPNSQEYYKKLRDDVNKAFISERISDCHVQKFFRTVMYIEKQVNYEDVTNELIGIRIELEDCIIKYRRRSSGENNESFEDSLVTFESEQTALLNDIEELLMTVIQSLVRLEMYLLAFLFSVVNSSVYHPVFYLGKNLFKARAVVYQIEKTRNGHRYEFLCSPMKY